jgi:hypothetical protein
MVVPGVTKLRPEGTATHSAALVLLGRVYLASEGVTEPYVDLGAGAARVETASLRTEHGVVRDAAIDLTFEVGGGLDFFISSKARLGPAVTFVHALVDEPSACPAQLGEVCSSVGRRWRLLSMTTLGARLSLLFGDPL